MPYNSCLSEAKRVVDAVLESYFKSPVDIFGKGHHEGETNYLKFLRASYIRTVSDVLTFFSNRRASLLEIGSYLGVVSIALQELGYCIHSCDIPEFHNAPRLRAVYERRKIPYSGINLRSASLPYPDESFDGVIMCEVIEHLNFNPIPPLLEINRTIKPEGLLYLGTPNLVKLTNRVRFLLGRSIHHPIREFLSQLDPEDNMIVGLHWREYSSDELRELLEITGYKVIHRSFHVYADERRQTPIKKILGSLIYWGV